MADHARRCAHSMGHGGVLLRSHTRVRPTFPFVQFKPPRAGERIRAVPSTLYRARRQTMGGANKWFIALSAALAVAAVSSQTVAQDSAARDAAIARCIKEAQTAYPLDGDDQGRNRTALYKACMTAAGFNP